MRNYVQSNIQQYAGVKVYLYWCWYFVVYIGTCLPMFVYPSCWTYIPLHLHSGVPV
ncbi:MAG: hypothetical protein ACLGH8_03225 [Bacteroidia bacterium]